MPRLRRQTLRQPCGDSSAAFSLTDSHQNHQDNRLTFVKIERADLRMPRSDVGRTPSPGSAVLNCAAATKKVLPLPPPLYGKQLHQVFHGQVRWVLPVQDRIHKGRRQVGQAEDPAHKRRTDVLGLGHVLDRRVGAVEQLAVPAVAARDEALTALESALNLAPDLPAALRLRKAMLK